VREPMRVWIDQDLCTGDGLCAQYSPEVFELDIDGLAYVKDGAGDLQSAPGAAVSVPEGAVQDVVDSAKECPGNCIHVVRTSDGTPVAGPQAE
jgi:ferredoxin